MIGRVLGPLLWLLLACTHACRKLFSQHSFKAQRNQFASSPAAAQLQLQIPIKRPEGELGVGMGMGISFVADGGRRFVNNKQVECKLSVAVFRRRKEEKKECYRL